VSSDRPRLIVLGLDSVSPEILRRFAPVMPRLSALLAEAVRGKLTSCDPPITVPAWAVMFSGVDPGSLGLYGFRHRRPGSYSDYYIPTSGTPQRPLVWDLLSRLGRRVAVIGMPPGYPPPSLNGVAISDFLTPDHAPDWVNPSRLSDEVARAAGGPFFDIPFRVDDRREVARSLLEMTERRWRAVRHLWKQEPWDLFAVHDIGPDRLHHAFWKYFDERHPRFVRDPDLSSVGERFYALLDREIGSLVDLAGPDVPVLVVSDHGSQAMEGCFCVNEWLIEHGYLALRPPAPRAGTPIESADVDWSRTRVWGAGGYYARLFFNVRGREPEGIVEPSEVSALVERLRQELNQVRRPGGAPLGVRLFAPSEVYQEVVGDPPDLMAYFGDVKWRSAGTVGHGRLFLEENDTGPDDAVHSFEGVYALRDPALGPGREGGTQRIIDIAPTVLRRFGVIVPYHVQGKAIPGLLVQGSPADGPPGNPGSAP
jgi:predicted AlkP superfamily phosphohydrolase/phosphomutase